MSLNSQMLVVPCFIGGTAALFVLVLQLAGYRFYTRLSDSPTGREPSLRLAFYLMLIMLLPVVPIAVNNDPRGSVVFRGIMAGSVGIVAVAVGSGATLLLLCYLFEKSLGWPRPPVGRTLVYSVLALPAITGIVLLGCGIECRNQSQGRYGGAPGVAGLVLLGVAVLLTMLATNILRIASSRALAVTTLHGLFVVVLVGLAWIGVMGS